MRAQNPGDVDPSFVTRSIGATIYAVETDNDAAFGGTAVRFTAGGDKGYGEYITPTGVSTIDFLLAPFGNAARIIYTIVPEIVIADDTSLPNLLLGGQFDGGGGRGTNNNKPAQNIIRIKPDGSIDDAFSTNIGSGANNYVTSILPLGDGRIVVGGLFTAFNHQPHRRIVRLLGNGTVDSGFATGANIDNDVLAVAEGMDSTGAADGNTLVGGLFNHVGGQNYGKLVRLDPNGNLDLSFHPSIDLRVLAIFVQDDGKIIIGGDFTNVNGTKVSHLARLNYNGSLDTTFVGAVSGVPNNDVNPTAVYVLKPLGNGQIYVGGEFAQLDGAPRRYLGLINPDGTLYTPFDPANHVNNSVQSIAIQSDYNILIGETVGPRINNKFPPSLIRLIGVTPVTAATDSVPAVKTSQTNTQRLSTTQTAVPAGRVPAARLATSGAPAR